MTEKQLAAEIPNQHEIRAELEAMVLGDLLGPSGGPDEELTERNVRDRYIVGVLAPSRCSTKKEWSEDALAEEDETDQVPLIPDELAEGGRDSADDGTTDKDTPIATGHLPSSLGMTFCVDASASSLSVTAKWGHYKREKREGEVHGVAVQIVRVWKRYSRGGSVVSVRQYQCLARASWSCFVV